MANIYKKLVELLPAGDQRNIGTVETVNTSAGTTTLTTLGGGHVTVIGISLSVGDKAYFKDGVIESKAPDLPVYEIEV
nr:hypothetical protein [uncultured Tolumonas sp.]